MIIMMEMNRIDISCELSTAADVLEGINGCLVDLGSRDKSSAEHILALIETALKATASDLRRYADASPTVQEG